MKLTTTIDITPEEALQLAGNPIYSWLSATQGDTAGKLERNEDKEGDCMGMNENPASDLSRTFSDMYKYTVVEPCQNMQSFWNNFGTWSSIDPLIGTEDT